MTSNITEFNTGIQIQKMSSGSREMFRAKRSDVIPKTKRLTLNLQPSNKQTFNILQSSNIMSRINRNEFKNDFLTL